MTCSRRVHKPFPGAVPVEPALRVVGDVAGGGSGCSLLQEKLKELLLPMRAIPPVLLESADMHCMAWHDLRNEVAVFSCLPSVSRCDQVVSLEDDADQQLLEWSKGWWWWWCC